MKNLLYKEFTLSASSLSFFFIAFALMTMLPGYPILMGAFFVSFGIFQTFQACRESNDITYSALLPVNKADIVKGKFIFAIFIEACGFFLMTVLTLVRMSVLSEAAVYVNNALLSANFVFLGFALVVFGCFNAVFIRGFFKTAYYFAKPLIGFFVTSLLIIGIAETLPHIPGFEALGSHGFENLPVQLAVFGAGALIYALLTAFACKASVKSFEKTDL